MKVFGDRSRLDGLRLRPSELVAALVLRIYLGNKEINEAKILKGQRSPRKDLVINFGPDKTFTETELNDAKAYLSALGLPSDFVTQTFMEDYVLPVAASTTRCPPLLQLDALVILLFFHYSLQAQANALKVTKCIYLYKPLELMLAVAAAGAAEDVHGNPLVSTDVSIQGNETTTQDLIQLANSIKMATCGESGDVFILQSVEWAFTVLDDEPMVT